MEQIDRVRDIFYADRGASTHPRLIYYPYHPDRMFIGSGWDSHVYRVEKHVVKVYSTNDSGERSKEELERYHEVTNRAAQYCLEHEMYFTYEKTRMRVFVNPSAGYWYSEEMHCMVGVAGYIAGDSIRDILPNMRVHEKISPELAELSTMLNEELHTEGILINTDNVRVVEGNLVITDLCTRIASLKVEDTL